MPSTIQDLIRIVNRMIMDGTIDLTKKATYVPLNKAGDTMSGPLTLSGGGMVELELRPDLDQSRVAGLGQPTVVVRGAVSGFSLPLYAANEELFFNMCIPDRWDGASDITAKVYCYLAAAEDDHAFRLQVTWERFRPSVNEVVSDDTSKNVEVETDTGAGAPQYKSFNVEFTIPYDTAGRELQADDKLNLRLRRINKTGAKDECGGEIVVTHLGLVFIRDKLGVAAP